MKIRTIFYLVGQGIVNIFKNRLMSFAAITTISACIFVVSIFYMVGENVEFMLDNIETNMGMQIFFEFDTTEERIQDIETLLNARNEVHEVVYISPEEAWARFKENYFQGNEEQLAGFEGNNPLKDSASLVVYFDDLDSQRSLANYVSALPDVRYIQQSEQVVNFMQSMNQLVRYSSLVLVVILVIISVFLIANTVRLGISTRKKEIEIMKYMGAKDAFIKGPFVIEGIIIGLVGTALPLGVVYYFYDKVVDGITVRFGLLRDILVFMELNDLLVTLVPLAAGVGMLIGLIGSRLTIGSYLKV